MMSWPILSVLIWLPILGGAGILALGDERPQLARIASLAVSVAALVVAVLLYLAFNNTTADMQFTELGSWIAAFNVNYHLGVDGLSLPLILLTVFFGGVACIAGKSLQLCVFSCGRLVSMCRDSRLW